MNSSTEKGSKGFLQPPFRHRLTVRLVWFAVFVGLVTGILLSVMQLTLDFQRERQTKEHGIQQLMSSLEGAAADAAYHVDDARGRAVLSGLFVLPAVYRAELKDDFGDTLVQHATGVLPEAPNFFAHILFGEQSVRELTLFLPERQESIGSMRVWLDLNLLAEGFASRVWLVVISGLVHNIVLAGMLALLFYFILAKPLVTAVIEIKSNREDKGEAVTIPKIHTSSELGMLLSSFNELISERSQQSKMFRSVMDASPVPLMIVRYPDGEFSYANRALGSLLGINVENVAGKSIEDFYVSLNDRKRIIDTVAMDGEIKDFEVFMTRADGTLLWVNLNGRLANFEGDQVVVSGLFDITERKRAESRLTLAASVFTSAHEGIMIVDSEGKILDANDALVSISGYKRHEMIGQPSQMFCSGRHEIQLYASMWKELAAEEYWAGEVSNRKKNGESYTAWLTLNSVQDAQHKERRYVAFISDITATKEHQRQLEHLAHFDSLTGLPNRVLVLDRLTQMIKTAHRNQRMAGVMFLDMDDFKKVNDALGHEAGDQLLIQAAERLTSAIREVDIVGRFGGDEFVVLLDGLSEVSDVQVVAESILNQFRSPFLLKSRELTLTVTLGISLYPNDGSAPGELLSKADIAMYHAKSLGRNAYHYFTDAMNRDVARRLELEECLYSALRYGEFKVHYQPLVDLSTSKIVGAEALLRWQSPVLGNVSPEEFIPIAEQTGLIVKIGEYVLIEALSEVANWQKLFNQPYKMAVNFSPRQLLDSSLMSTISDALKQADITGEYLELEITEGVLLRNPRHVEETLNALRELGVSISMDDFGTGYSSLSYLRQFPFDTLKIDRSFVNDMEHNLADRELVNAAITMAHGLGLSVVAEGVETRQQRVLLAARGCDFAQGYFYSKPLPSSGFVELLKAQSVGEHTWLPSTT